MSKYWKEASSVIIAARVSFTKDIKNSFSANKMDSLNKDKMIFNSKSTNNETCFPNFKVLALRRSTKNSFMPDSYVFPGGQIDASDSSEEWIDLFKQYGKETDSFEPFKSIKNISKVNMFENQSNEEILKSVSLRITGIRETFEEAGILLCSSKKSESGGKSCKWASFLTGYEIQKWQERVQNDPTEFITLCRHFKCYPDIWALQEWSNWLSPNHFPKRFNTAFFHVALDQILPAFSTGGEINNCQWSYPEELVNASCDQEIILPPPQFYELSRLRNFNDIEQLADYSIDINRLPCELWMPVRMKTLDGEVTIFPGDELYPDDPNFGPDKMKEMNVSTLELRAQCHQLHRMEHTKECNTRLLISNAVLREKQKHILPWVAPF